MQLANLFEEMFDFLAYFLKKLDGEGIYVVHFTGDMEVRSFFYARNHDGYMILHGCENVDQLRSIMEKGPCK